jgi:hypothetical protein
MDYSYALMDLTVYGQECSSTPSAVSAGSKATARCGELLTPPH